MALYQNGILISGANTLPQMTLAEYQALPVSERPTYWERTDLNYNNIPASNVTYGSGSVEDRLDMVSNGVTFPSTAYITTAGGSATASKDGFAGGTFIQSSGDNRAAWITVNGNQVAYIGGASYSDMPMIFLYYVHAGDVIETRSGVGKYHILVP